MESHSTSPFSYINASLLGQQQQQFLLQHRFLLLGYIFNTILEL